MNPQIIDLLNHKAQFYNQPQFIESDPIQIPHQFKQKEDIEISGLLTAIISWGNRKAIISSSSKLMQLLDHAPYDFVLHATDKDFQRLNSFVYRTFNCNDLTYFILSLQNIYKNKGGLEAIFTSGFKTNCFDALELFRSAFFSDGIDIHASKHIANVVKGSSAKRLNMFLRWMVRNDNCGVDFGLWKNISPSKLKLPLDLHSANMSRQLGLLSLKQNNWKAVEEVSNHLILLDPLDPIKYDFALFGMSIFENFKYVE